MKKSFISVLMVIALLFSAIVCPLSNASAFGEEEKKPEEIVLDFSFFELNYASDPEKYHDAAETFFRDFKDLAEFVLWCDTSDLDKYVKCTKALRWNDFCDYTNNEKYTTQLYDYLDNYKGDTDYTSSGIEYVEYFQNNYDKSIEKVLDNDITELLTETSKLDKSQFNLAIKRYNNIIKICDAFLSISEGHKGATDKKAEAQKCLDKVMGSVDSKIFSSDVHKNNIGKILFSKNNIVAGKETAASFSTSFDTNSNIYAIAYLSTPLQKIVPKSSYYPNPNETCSANAWIKIDGMDNLYGNIMFDVDIQDYQANKGYVTFEILPNAKSTKGDNLKEWYDLFLSRLTEGKHTIEIDIQLKDTTIASGSFDIDWTNADLDKISKNINKCIKVSEDYRANKAQVPGVFKVKSLKYKDQKTLSDKKIEAVLKKERPDITKIMKMVNVGDITDGWSVEKNELGIPVAKYSTMNTWALFKAKDGWCYIVNFSLKCTYLGGGTYSAPFIDSIATRKIAAKNVK